MLTELWVRDFALIEETRIDFRGGLNVITGETGAGKSLLVDALEYVLGGSADQEQIRMGSDSCNVEAVFTGPVPSLLIELAGSHGSRVTKEDPLVLSRATHRKGRTVSKLNGATVPAQLLRAAGALLVDLHVQGSHLALLDNQFQLRVLDAFGGLSEQASETRTQVARVLELQLALNGLLTDARLIEQKKDLLNFQVSEINNAELKPDEENRLVEEQTALTHTSDIREASQSVYHVLSQQEASVSELLEESIRSLNQTQAFLPELALQSELLENIGFQVLEVTRELRSIAENANSDPTRLTEVTERIQLIRSLKRKYGDTETSVLSFSSTAQAELDGLEALEDTREELSVALGHAKEEAAQSAYSLSRQRQEVAKSLVVQTSVELSELGLDRVSFDVQVSQKLDPDGLSCDGDGTFAFNESGIDYVNFLIETNPGEGFHSLARIASGGETARMMLAIQSALHQAGGAATLVFDEIDSGIGGRSADVVGKKMWQLGATAQILCVTHLPQIAAFGDTHFRVEKSLSGGRMVARTITLTGEDQIQELAQMIGGPPTAELNGAARRMIEFAMSAKIKP